MPSMEKIKPLAGKKEIKVKVKINLRTILLVLFLLLFLLPGLFAFLDMKGTDSKVELSQVLTDLKENKIAKVMVESDKLLLTYKDGSVKYSTKEPNESFTDLLDKVKIDPTTVNYTIVDGTLTKAFGEILGVILPVLLMAGV